MVDMTGMSGVRRRRRDRGCQVAPYGLAILPTARAIPVIVSPAGPAGVDLLPAREVSGPPLCPLAFGGLTVGDDSD